MLITKLANKLLPTSLLLVAVALVAIPIMTIAITAASGSIEVIASISHSVLPRYISTTIWILLGTGAGCLFWGIACAGIVTWYQFPARRIFCWALALPLAIPAYVTGFVYTQFAENPVINALGIEIRSEFGLILLFSFTLFPYVFFCAYPVCEYPCLLRVAFSLMSRAITKARVMRAICAAAALSLYSHQTSYIAVLIVSRAKICTVPKSFRASSIARVHPAAIAGRALGRAIRRKFCLGENPSMRPASNVR